MSVEAAGDFVLQYLADPAAKAKVGKVYLQALSEMAAERNYDVTPEELAAVIRDANRSSADGTGDQAGLTWDPLDGIGEMPLTSAEGAETIPRNT